MKAYQEPMLCVLLFYEEDVVRTSNSEEKWSDENVDMEGWT